MEDQVLSLLVSTLDSSAPIRTDAERRLDHLYSNQAFPLSLLSIASHTSVPVQHRQAALLSLKKLVLKLWSPSLDGYEGPVEISDEIKLQIRSQVLAVATAANEQRKIVAAASYVVSKIASADFPEHWPDLLPKLLALVPSADDSQLYAILIVLGDLVDESFDEEQFTGNAARVVKVIHDVATDPQKQPMTRSLAISILRSCLDTIEAVLQTNPPAVQEFMQMVADSWVPFFIQIVRNPLPRLTQADEAPTSPDVMKWRGDVALKTQAVKSLDKIHTVFPHFLSSQALELFNAMWEAIQAHLAPYHTLYTGEELREGQLEDSDRLPYSLDLLVMEELDYTQTLLSTMTVKQELDKQLATLNTTVDSSSSPNWLQQLLNLSIGYAFVTAEDANMWEFDINTYLAEEATETAQYSARNAAAGVVTKLCSYKWPVLENLLPPAKSAFEGNEPQTKAMEASMYIIKQVLDEISSFEGVSRPETLRELLALAQTAMNNQEDDFLRARGYICASSLISAPGNALAHLAPEYGYQAIKAIEADGSEIVQVSGMKALQAYLRDIPANLAQDFQNKSVAAVSAFLTGQDFDDIDNNGEDLLATLLETLRDAIAVDPTVCLENSAIHVLFTLASHGAKSWTTSDLATEAFESIVSAMSKKSPAAYAELCKKIIPSLTAALDVGDLTEENSLSDMAVALMAVLAEYGTEPLPDGFVAALIPKLYRLLFLDVSFNVHQSATLTWKHILAHDSDQLFNWQEAESGRGGLEISLLVIDRLLGPDVQDSSAAEVGGLAMELVQKAGVDRLGPFLMQLLRVVAVRLSTAERADFVQNLVLVFARLALTNATEVLDFLAQVEVPGHDQGGSGLEVVMRKWLDNCINFTGYEAIRQNVQALIAIFRLQDARLDQIQTRGDLIVDGTSTRIKTRSQAKKQPDQYTVVPVSLKLVKVLVQEIVPVAQRLGLGAGLRAGLEDAEDEDDEWEDEVPMGKGTVLDLSASGTRMELMSFMDDADRWNLHQSDDETQACLVAFFTQVWKEPGFQRILDLLTPAERERLASLGEGNK